VTAAMAAFSVINRVTNLSANLTCHILNDACRVDSIGQDESLRVTLSSSGKVARVFLTQIWVCNE
jgi:hypothetical protein